MRRVVVTGLGIVSPLGADAQTVTAALQAGTSATRLDPVFKEMGFRCHVSAPIPNLAELAEELDRKQKSFHGKGDTLLIGHLAMARAVADSGLTLDQISDPMVGLYCGTGGPSTEDQVQAVNTTIEKGGPKRMGPRMVTPTMSSGLQAVLCTQYQIKGLNISMTSACATSAHSIGEAWWAIRTGRQNIMFAGGSEDCHWTKACGFDAMPALAQGFNDSPEVASRAFDAGRSGFVDAAGGGMIVLEEYEAAKARGAKIYAELVGYGANSDGDDMVAPSGEGAERCMKMALSTVDGDIDYVNPHGTSTPVGDVKEVGALASIFSARQEALPLLASTKSMTGHALGGAGVTEAIYTLLMMQGDFVAPSINIDEIDPEIAALGWTDFIPREARERKIRQALSNSFGFGGTNASLVFAAV